MYKNFSTRLLFVLTIAVMIYTLIFPSEVTYHAKKAVELCITAVFPSLYMFIVLANLLSRLCESVSYNTKPIRFLSKLLCVEPVLVPLCFLGLFCGAPSCAIAIGTMYKNRLCSKIGAENAVILSSNCSFAFIVTIGATATGQSTAFIIAVSNILTTLIVYICFFRRKIPALSPTQKTRRKSMSQSIFTQSIREGFSNTLFLCSYVIFFYVISFILSQKAEVFLSGFAENKDLIYVVKSFIHGIFEITSGVLSVPSFNGNVSAMMTSFFCAFCSLSVILQVSSVCGMSDLSQRGFIQSKIICSLISPVVTLLLIFILKKDAPVMSVTMHRKSCSSLCSDLVILAFISCIFVICVQIVSYVDKKHKNK